MLPPDVLRQVRRLKLRGRREVRSRFAGDYRSAFKGVGLSFEEVREYQPGDDVRTIDWNVTARTGTPFVKRFAEERERTVLIVLNLSASLRFGTTGRTKRAVAAELAAVVALAAVGQNDRVGLVGFTDRVERHVPPGKGHAHTLRLLRDLLFHEPARPGTDTAAALTHVARAYRRRAVVFLFTDFLSPVPFADAFRRVARRHDFVAVRVVDPREETLPAVGLMELEDAETGRRFLLDTADRRTRDTFASRAAGRAAEVAALARGAAAELIVARTDGTHFDALHAFFRRRDRSTGGRA